MTRFGRFIESDVLFNHWNAQPWAHVYLCNARIRQRARRLDEDGRSKERKIPLPDFSGLDAGCVRVASGVVINGDLFYGEQKMKLTDREWEERQKWGSRGPKGSMGNWKAIAKAKAKREAHEAERKEAAKLEAEKAKRINKERIWNALGEL